MNKMTKEFRDNIAEIFIKSLEEDQLQWKKNWNALHMLPQNAVTGAVYKGVNRFYLTFLCQRNEWEDPRFATFKQISDKGWHLKKGSKGMKVEYWMPYDRAEKKVISWNDVDLESKDIGLVAKYYTVFNAKDIEGIPPMPEPEKKDIKPDEILKTIQKNMKIEILNDGKNRAFYRPSEDKIHLPEPEYFDSDYAYNSVAMHELAHATGAEHRLNRNLENVFGSADYAFEELVAEMTSVFMSNDLLSCMEFYELDNHKAYIQSWIKHIKESPDVLMQAIKEANKAADYLEEAAELVQKKVQETVIEVDSDKILPVPMSEKEYMMLKGVESPFGAYQDDKLIGHVNVLAQKSTKKDFENESVEYWNKRQQSREEYRNLKEEGILREPTSIEKTIETASGHPDNESTQAAQRMLEKRGIDPKDVVNNQNPLEVRRKEIVRDLVSKDFRPTKRLVGNIQKLDRITGKNNTLSDIVKMHKGKIPFADNAKDVLEQIVKECRAQEMMLCQQR